MCVRVGGWGWGWLALFEQEPSRQRVAGGCCRVHTCMPLRTAKSCTLSSLRFPNHRRYHLPTATKHTTQPIPPPAASPQVAVCACSYGLTGAAATGSSGAVLTLLGSPGQ